MFVFPPAVISYGWVTGGEDDSKRKLYATTDNGRLLGPICLIVSLIMFVATAVLRTLSTNARFRQTRVGFHCPVHGDFFPISPGPDPRKFSCESKYFSAKLCVLNITCIDTRLAEGRGGNEKKKVILYVYSVTEMTKTRVFQSIFKTRLRTSHNFQLVNGEK